MPLHFGDHTTIAVPAFGAVQEDPIPDDGFLRRPSERYEMTGSERLLVYRIAIQSGLRSSELRILTRGQLYLDCDPPYITCRDRSTKNKKDAQQYILPNLAEDLNRHVATMAPKVPLFALPSEYNMADMLRADVADARRQWLKSVRYDSERFTQCEKSDFLTDVNHEGEVLDFHSLRHTCGAWLAMTGAHPKVVQTVMRHASITLTMDTYGHLFPGQEADAVAQLGYLLAGPPEALRATGTDNATADTPNGAQRQTQRAGREYRQSGARGCDDATNPTVQNKTHKPLRAEDLCEEVPCDATECESRAGRTRTCNQQIMSLSSRSPNIWTGNDLGND